MKPVIVGLFLCLGLAGPAHAVVDDSADALTQSGNTETDGSKQDSWGDEPTSSTGEPKATLTPFNARYESEWNLGWFSIDIKGSRQLKRLDNDRWELVFEADSSAASLKEVSVFSVDDGQIQPLEYRYQVSGLVTEPDRSLEFRPDDEIIRDHKKNKDHTNQWAPGIQDAQTYMLQASLDLMLHPTLPLSYPVFEKKRTKVFNFEIVGEEIIKTRAGKLNTIKIQQVRKDNRRVTVWLIKDKQFLLARLVDKQNGKTRYKIDLVAID